MKKAISYALFIVVGAFFIYMAFKNVNPTKLWNDIKGANFFWISLVWIAGMFSNYSRAARWNIIVEPLGYKPKLSNSFHGVMISYLINFAIPRGGELARATALSRVERMPIATVIGSVVAERVMDVVFMGLVILLALGFQFDIIMDFLSGASGDSDEPGSSKAWIWIALGAMAILAIAFFYLRKKLSHLQLMQKIDQLYKGFISGLISLTRIKKPLIFLVHSINIWVMYFAMVYLCFFAFEPTAHLGVDAGLTVLMISTIAVILPAPGGLGTFHTFVPMGLLLYDIPQDEGLSYATIAHASQMLMFVFFGTISLITMITLQRKAASE